MKKILFLFVFLTVSGNELVASKSIKAGSSAGNSLEAINRFMKKGDLLSEDLKNAFREKDAQGFNQLGQLSIAIIVAAYSRPSTKDMEKVQERVETGKATLDDLLKIHDDINSYGEAMLDNKGDLKLLETEPTKAEYYLPTSLWDPSFEPIYKKAETAIEYVGKKMEWDKNKIDAEKKIYFGNVARFIKTNQAK